MLPQLFSGLSQCIFYKTGAHTESWTRDLSLTKGVLYLWAIWAKLWFRIMERVAGIEPAPSAWKAEVLPLNYTRNATRPSILDLLLTWLGNIQITIAGKWWWGKDSNLRSSRNGFTVRPLWPLGNPTIFVFQATLNTWLILPSVLKDGAGCRNRTGDLLITSQLLYQLS